MRWVLGGSVAVRIVAAVVLVAGPWTNEVGELAGWDVARFQEIATEPGRHWVDHDVEYPPGSVVAIEALAGENAVETHRTLVALSLAIDLGVAALVGLLGGRRAAAWYLVLGLPLVPMGLLRFDLWSVGFAVVALVALAQRKPAAFGVMVAAGAMVKVWPALLVAAAVAVGRRVAALWAVAAGAVAGVGWLAYGGFSGEPIRQVVSLRGATGWHVESVGGTLSVLVGGGAGEAERQLDAYRVGTLSDGWVLGGRLLAIAVIVGLVVLALRSSGELVERASLVTLGSTAALIVTAPLLSPQFLLWLTPWAALLAARSVWPTPAILTAIATTITGAVLMAFGPPNLDTRLPAALLLGRNLVLVAIVAAASYELWRPHRPLTGQ